MAKNKNTIKAINVSGLSTSDILNWEFEEINKMSNRALKQITSRLVSSANKRLRNIEKANKTKFNVPYQKVMEEGGKFSVKGKNRQQTLSEYARAKEYLESKTSSLKGYKTYREKVKSRVGLEGATDEEESEFWEEYNYINKHSRNNYNEILGSDQMQRIVAKAKNEGKSHKQIMSVLRNTYKKEKAKREQRIKELVDDLDESLPF